MKRQFSISDKELASRRISANQQKKTKNKKPQLKVGKRFKQTLHKRRCTSKHGKDGQLLQSSGKCKLLIKLMAQNKGPGTRLIQIQRCGKVMIFSVSSVRSTGNSQGIILISTPRSDPGSINFMWIADPKFNDTVSRR